MTSLNFLDFPKLEKLHLSAFNFDMSPEIKCAALLAPNLHTLVWDFTGGEYEDGS